MSFTTQDKIAFCATKLLSKQPLSKKGFWTEAQMKNAVKLATKIVQSSDEVDVSTSEEPLPYV